MDLWLDTLRRAFGTCTGWRSQIMTFVTSGFVASFVCGVLLAVIVSVVIACATQPRRKRRYRQPSTVTSSVYDEGVVTATTGFGFHENAGDGNENADGMKNSVNELKSSVTTRNDARRPDQGETDPSRRNDYNNMADILLMSTLGLRDRKKNTDANENNNKEDRICVPSASLEPDSVLSDVTTNTVLRGRTTLLVDRVTTNLAMSSSPSIAGLDQLKAQLVHEQDRRTVAEDWSMFLMATLRAYLSARAVFERRPRVASATTAQFKTKPLIESMGSVKEDRSDVVGCSERNMTTSSLEDHSVAVTSSQYQPITDDGSSELCYENWLAGRLSEQSVGKSIVRPETDEEIAEWEEAVSYNEMILQNDSTVMANRCPRWRHTNDFKLPSVLSAHLTKTTGAECHDEHTRGTKVERETHQKVNGTDLVLVDCCDELSLANNLTAESICRRGEQLSQCYNVDKSISKKQVDQLKCLSNFVASCSDSEPPSGTISQPAADDPLGNGRPEVVSSDGGSDAKTSDDGEDAAEVWMLSVRDRVNSWRKGGPCRSLAEVQRRSETVKSSSTSLNAHCFDDNAMTSALLHLPTAVCRVAKRHTADGGVLLAASRTSESTSNLCFASTASSAGPSLVATFSGEDDVAKGVDARLLFDRI